MEGRHKVVSALLAAGANPEVPGQFDARAALHHAAFNGHLEVVRRLVRDGKAMVDQPSALTNGNGPGHTPLLVACFQVCERARLGFERDALRARCLPPKSALCAVCV